MSNEAKREWKRRIGGCSKQPDTLAFGITTLVVFAIYLWTLAPQITLGSSGIYAAGAMYPGPSMPPGHPLWAIFGWVAIKLIPFSNIAWRLGVASALAGAIASGFVALIVSTAGRLILKAREQRHYRVACAVMAGLGFAFDGAVWSKTVIGDPWPLTLFLFVLTIYFISRWFFTFDGRRCLYAAAFMHGLTLTEGQALSSATYALPFLLIFRNRKLATTMLLGLSVCLWGVLMNGNTFDIIGVYPGEGARRLLKALAMISTLATVVLSIAERAFFREAKTLLISAALFIGGTCFCLLLPIFSMTNPPVNWGYPRVDEGFFHVLSRGQFDSMDPAMSFSRFTLQIKNYVRVAVAEVGPLYLAAAAFPFLRLRSARSKPRRWLLGSLLACFVMAMITVVGLNADSYRSSEIKALMAPTHLFLFLFAGCGSMQIISLFDKSRGQITSPRPDSARVPQAAPGSQ